MGCNHHEDRHSWLKGVRIDRASQSGETWRKMEKETSRLEKAGALGNNIAKRLRAQTLVRFLGTPFQKLFDKAGGTHRFLTERAVEIARADGFAEAATFCDGWLDTIIRGNYWADLLWMNATHHYNPRTKRGLWIWAGASDQVRNWWSLAMSSWKKGDIERSVFMLGACLHIVQDCCQPYHSNCLVFDGHQKYERWADSHKEEYVVTHGGLYRVSLKPEGWAVANAEMSYGHLASVASELDGQRDRATAILLPRAMRTGAGFLVFFREATIVAAAKAREKKMAAG